MHGSARALRGRHGAKHTNGEHARLDACHGSSMRQQRRHPCNSRRCPGRPCEPLTPRTQGARGGAMPRKGLRGTPPSRPKIRAARRPAACPESSRSPAAPRTGRKRAKAAQLAPHRANARPRRSSGHWGIQRCAAARKSPLVDPGHCDNRMRAARSSASRAGRRARARWSSARSRPPPSAQGRPLGAAIRICRRLSPASANAATHDEGRSGSGHEDGAGTERNHARRVCIVGARTQRHKAHVDGCSHCGAVAHHQPSAGCPPQLARTMAARVAQSCARIRRARCVGRRSGKAAMIGPEATNTKHTAAHTKARASREGGFQPPPATPPAGAASPVPRLSTPSCPQRGAPWSRQGSARAASPPRGRCLS